MHCDEFERRLERLLDRRQCLAADERLAAHAAWCGDCAEQLAAHQTLLAALSPDTLPSPGVDLADAVLGKLYRVSTAKPAQSLPARRRRRPLMLAACCTAAGLLLAVVVFMPHDRTAPPIEQADVAPAVPEQAPAVEAPAVGPAAAALTTAGPAPAAVSLRQLTGPSQRALWRMRDNLVPMGLTVQPYEMPDYGPWLEQVRQATARLPEASAAMAMDRSARLLEQRRWLDEVTDSLRPVATSLGSAWGALRDTLPVHLLPPLQLPPEMPPAEQTPQAT